MSSPKPIVYAAMSREDFDHFKPQVAPHKIALADDLLNSDGCGYSEIRLLRGGNAAKTNSMLGKLEAHCHPVPVVHAEARPKIKLASMDGIETTPVDWLWPGWLARGKITLVVGDPAAGKTTAVCDLLARLSRGDAMPDGTRSVSQPIGSVYLSFDDAPDDVVVPRLKVAGAELSRVHWLEGVTILGDGDRVKRFKPEHLEALGEAIEGVEKLSGDPIGVMVLDPLGPLMEGKKSNSLEDTYAMFDDLRRFIEPRGISLIIPHHAGKGRRDKAIDLGIGSQAIIASARFAAYVTNDRDDPDRRLWLSAKASVGRMPEGLSYSIIDSELPDTGKAAWDSENVNDTAQSWLDGTGSDDASLTGQQLEAARWLMSVAAGDERRASQIADLAEQEGIKERTLKTVKSRFGIGSVKSATEGWRWIFPGELPDAGEGLKFHAS